MMNSSSEPSQPRQIISATDRRNGGDMRVSTSSSPSSSSSPNDSRKRGRDTQTQSSSNTITTITTSKGKINNEGTNSKELGPLLQHEKKSNDANKKKESLSSDGISSKGKGGSGKKKKNHHHHHHHRHDGGSTKKISRQGEKSSVKSEDEEEEEHHPLAVKKLPHDANIVPQPSPKSDNVVTEQSSDKSDRETIDPSESSPTKEGEAPVAMIYTDNIAAACAATNESAAAWMSPGNLEHQFGRQRKSLLERDADHPLVAELRRENAQLVQRNFELKQELDALKQDVARVLANMVPPTSSSSSSGIPNEFAPSLDPNTLANIPTSIPTNDLVSFLSRRHQQQRFNALSLNNPNTLLEQLLASTAPIPAASDIQRLLLAGNNNNNNANNNNGVGQDTLLYDSLFGHPPSQHPKGPW